MDISTNWDIISPIALDQCEVSSLVTGLSTFTRFGSAANKFLADSRMNIAWLSVRRPSRRKWSLRYPAFGFFDPRMSMKTSSSEGFLATGGMTFGQGRWLMSVVRASGIMNKPAGSLPRLWSSVNRWNLEYEDQHLPCEVQSRREMA